MTTSSKTSPFESDMDSKLNVFLVGGAVRDHLLGREILERDYLVVGSTPEQMDSLGFKIVGKDFPVYLHPQTKEEYALARTERKKGHGYKGFECYAEPDVTIEEDLIRRDLTVNAMAMSADGQIIDPYHGQKDLQDKILRHVSPAFAEDPLRVLRVARFAARYHQYGFEVAEETYQLMQQMAKSGELTSLTPERIFKELSRALDEPNPEVFFTVLKKSHALSEIWPELDNLWDVPNPAQHHPEICSAKHTLLALQQAVKLHTSTQVRFAVLCHDLGKGLTPSEYWPQHRGHEKSGLTLVEKSCQRFKVPNDYKALALLSCEFHLHAHRAFELKPSTLLNLFNQFDIWRNQSLFEEFILVCQADFNGRTGHEDFVYHQADYLVSAANAAKAIVAKPFVMQGLKGKAIKEAMNQARLAQIKLIKSTWKNK